MAALLAVLLAAAGGWTPGDAQIDRLEALLVLPAGAAPLAAYDRSYAGIVRDDRRLIAGRLIAARTGRGTRRIVAGDAIGWTADRGCATIRLDYDPATGRFGAVSCGRSLPRQQPLPPAATAPLR